jgi:hypothetical protein
VGMITIPVKIVPLFKNCGAKNAVNVDYNALK